MYGLTRTTMTLIGVAAAGVLLWLGNEVLDPQGRPSAGEYWAWMALCAAAGLALALSQLLGGWTKWGVPQISPSVFLVAFVPTLIVGGWVVAYFDPSGSSLQENVADWSDDLAIDGFVEDLGASGLHVAAISLIIGLVFGFAFDTTGPRVRRGAYVDEEGRVVPEGPPVAGAGYAEQGDETPREAAVGDEAAERRRDDEGLDDERVARPEAPGPRREP